MTLDRLPSKFTFILHADIAGSTALVQQDEHLAHQRIQDTFRRFSATITQYHGQVRELRGDALLAEFERASDAVSAALAFQAEQAEYNASLNDNNQPTVRVGIAMGEVVIADDTITGAGVVLAQRVEQLAAPGGVSITGAIHEALPQRMPFDQKNLGEQQIKGFDEPVRVYTVGLKQGAQLPEPTAVSKPGIAPAIRWGMITATIVLILGGGLLAWYQPWTPEFEPASVEQMAFPLPDKPSIAVLPFNNMSDDPQQEYFVDGMTEDLITDLSNLSGLFVIARNSVFAYKDKVVKVRKVAKELGVRYVMEGSVRRVGNEVRINAQLIDATTGGHLWAKRYDGSVDDVFALQDDVTQRIVAALAVELTGEEVAQRDRKDAVNTAAYDAFLQGWAYYKLGTRADLAKAKPFFEEAIRLDPGYARAQAALATIYWDAFSNDWTFELGIFASEAEAAWEEHLELAMKVPNSLAHTLNSWVMLWQERYDEAVVEAEKAVALTGNDAAAIAGLADALVLVERPDEGLKYIQDAMRLDPYHPPGYLTILGAAKFGMENYDEAAATFERAVKRNPDNELPRIYLAAVYGHLGRIDDGEAIIESTNFLRATRGRPALSLRPAPIDSGGPFRGQIDFKAFGGKALRERVRSGLSRIPALTWQYLVAGVGIGPDGHEVKGATKIDTATAKAFHNRGVVFIDTSNESEWKKGHIPGAVNLPYYLDDTDPTEPWYQQATLSKIVDRTEEFVLVYCERDPSWCNVSFPAAKAVAWGLQKVYWYNSGVLGWREAGYPVEQGK